MDAVLVNEIQYTKWMVLQLVSTHMLTRIFTYMCKLYLLQVIAYMDITQGCCRTYVYIRYDTQEFSVYKHVHVEASTSL